MDVVADKAKPRLCRSLEKESFIFGEIGGKPQESLNAAVDLTA
jgi:hypothetical protein